MSSIFQRMYSGNLKNDQSSPRPPVVDAMKSAARRLGGMKVHGSHVKQVEVGDQIIDVPTIEYVRLLESQLKELKDKVRKLEDKDISKDNRINRLNSAVRDISRDMENVVRYK